MSRAVKRERHVVSLARLMVPGETSQPDILMEAFRLNVLTWLEDGQYVAICRPIEGVVAGVGESKQAAIDDFVEGFKVMVDYHTEKGTHEQFLQRYFDQEIETETIEIKIEEQSKREKFLALCPPWQVPEGLAAHVAA